MEKVKIAVHDGVFHADDVFAVAILKKIYPHFKLVRSRDESVLKECDFRIDVGGKHDPSTGDFDHHMSSGAGERENGIPYASCGLVWKHFGMQVAGTKFRSEHVERRLIQSIDAIDCGYSNGDEHLPFIHYSVSDMIDSLNPVWFEEDPDHDEAFMKGVETAERIIDNEIKRAEGYERSKDYVYEAIHHAVNPHYIVLERYCPWQHIVINETDILFVIFPSTTGDWRIRSVPRYTGSFESRMNLPKEWGGKSKEELISITGVEDALFCHPALFIAGAGSREGVLKMVDIVLNG